MALILVEGVWYERKQINGKRRIASTGYKEGDKAKAEKAAIKIVNRWLDEANGIAPVEAKPEVVVLTFGDWAATYEDTYSSKKSKPGRDAAIIKFWKTVPFDKKRVWADVPLDAFTQVHCIAGLDYRRKKGTLNPKYKVNKKVVAEGTVQRERGLVQAMFESARVNKHITGNPWEGVEKEPGDVRLRLLTADDEPKMLAVMTPLFSRFVEFVLETGLRLDEVRKIEPRDVHPAHVHVHGKGRKRRARCSVCLREGGKCRNVPLTVKAKRMLDDQWKAEGNYWAQSPARLREVVTLACERSGIAHISPHDLRHTFGHRWLTGQNSSGKRGDIYTLSKVLGHSSVGVTERHYAHLLDSDIDKRVREIMDGDAA